ncbi:hypothetical protein QRX50_33440 [Amycolatopsis carbonis]|uniref:Uncharacterized protein n=1 Tax=Amycolatopsis carbonis TaxID=715471 RepID=A0A9Y2MPR0_9PSEU|nr:hypothetical protein [Amycolatopsis sp. 2-15]WIX76345.1 hypothetical protein QRX50_33440 [Amycolatopsis sp. 2-15]
MVDFGFLDLVRLGVRAPADPTIAASIAPTAAASDGNAPMQVTLPDGDLYFHRYPHDNYGESTTACTAWPAGGPQRFGRSRASARSTTRGWSRAATATRRRRCSTPWRAGCASTGRPPRTCTTSPIPRHAVAVRRRARRTSGPAPRG